MKIIENLDFLDFLDKNKGLYLYFPNSIDNKNIKFIEKLFSFFYPDIPRKNRDFSFQWEKKENKYFIIRGCFSKYPNSKEFDYKEIKNLIYENNK